jgi:iron complex transport system substrate-binding protein
MTLPTRLICLTEEPTEVLYALGETPRIARGSGFSVRPAQAMQQRPQVRAAIARALGADLPEEVRLARQDVGGMNGSPALLRGPAC